MVQFLNSSSTPREARGRRRAQARRAEILRAAARCFRRHGFESTGMREIAAEADLSPGNLYHYFGGKQEILYYCQELWLSRMLDAVGEARRLGVSVTETLHALLCRHLSTLLSDVEGSVAHLEVEVLPEPLRTAIVARRDRYERELRRLLEEGAASGEFCCPQPELVTRAILGALNWSARWYNPDGALPPEHVARTFADYLLRGLLRDPGGGPREAPDPAGEEIRS